MSQKDKEVLKTMGFEEIAKGLWQHKLTGDAMFDFSAASLQGAIKHVFDEGVSSGRVSIQNEITKLLGLGIHPAEG